MKRNLTEPATMAKKCLLNASQRKYLTDRINTHYHNLYHEKSEDEPEPPKIVAARKLIDEWEDKVEAEAKAHQSTVRKALKAKVAKLTEALLFEATDDAIRKVAEFEEMTCEDFQSPPTSRRSGSPGWDEED